MAIHSDKDFKSALNKLPVSEQRRLAARFVANVASLCKDSRVTAAINAARRADISDAELAAVFQAAKAASVDSYTQCGKEADWLAQAGHFVAEAAESSVMPAERGRNLAWDAAMHARMARICAGIAAGRGTENSEAEQQYRLLAEQMENK